MAKVHLVVWDTDREVDVMVYTTAELAEKHVVADIINNFINWRLDVPNPREELQGIKDALLTGAWKDEYESIGDILALIDDDCWVEIYEREVEEA